LYQKAGSRRENDFNKMDLQLLQNPLPQQISETQGLQIPISRNTREMARVPLAQLPQEPVAHSLSPRLSGLHLTITPKPGPKAKPIADRTGADFAGVRRRIQRTYYCEFKIEVLRWWLLHQIPQGKTEREPGVTILHVCG